MALKLDSLKPGKAGIVSVMILAFLVYFLTESTLRQAAVSNINPQSVSVEGLVSKLPSSVRDSINYKIDFKRMRNAIKDAKTDTEKIVAIVNYAEFTKEPGQRLWLYNDLLKEYPSNPETVRVYTTFLLNEGDGPKLGVEDFQRYVAGFDQLNAYNIWIAGLNKLIAMKASPATIMKLLSPLLSMKPEYREYRAIYAEMAKLAEKEKLPGGPEAAKLAESCAKLKSMDEELAQKWKKEYDAEAAKGASGAKPGG